MTTRRKPRGICYWKSKQTHCERGHPFDDANTLRYTDRDGGEHRWCRQCGRDRQRRAYARRTGQLAI
jgi:hypothetical protein